MIAVMLTAPGAQSTPPTLPNGPHLSNDLPKFDDIVQVQAERLAVVTSDSEALALFTTQISSSVGLKDAASVLVSQTQYKRQLGEGLVAGISESAVRLVRGLAMWRLAFFARDVAADPTSKRLSSFLKALEDQRAWLQRAESSSVLTQAANLAEALNAYSAPQASDSASGYADYATALDRKFPDVVGSAVSWISITESTGLSGIKQRLVGGMTDQSFPEAFAAQYVRERLRAAFIVELAGIAHQTHAQESEQVYEEWLRLRSLRDRLREWRGLSRLCGTWQWTIHNHQNHGEEKLVLVFSLPGGGEAPGPRPTEIVALGDNLYLRWEVGGKVQEDSLLFTKEGQRLEGTFVNSIGGWGAISGKRTATCSP